MVHAALRTCRIDKLTFLDQRLSHEWQRETINCLAIAEDVPRLFTFGADVLAENNWKQEVVGIISNEFRCRSI